MKPRNDAIAIALLAVVIAILFADVLLGINSFFLRDIARYYHPAKHLLRDIVLGGEFPHWNPFVQAGQPLAANPEHEVFYPLTWLILLPSFEIGFNLLFILHLHIAAFTMYALLRSLDVRPPAAFFGALTFAIGGMALSQLNLLPILISVAWMPLTLLFGIRFLRTFSARDFAAAAFFLGLQLIIGEPTTVVQTGIILGIIALRERPRARRAGAVALISIAALCVGAVQVLPTLDHFRETTRARGLDLETVSQWSMPPQRLAELVYPHAVGRIALDAPYRGARFYPGKNVPFLFSIYSGLLLTALAFGGLLARARGSGTVLALLIISIVLALGGHTPLLRVLHELGIARSTRFPEKFILIAVFTLIAFGAAMLDCLLDGDARIRRTTIGVAAAVTLVAFALPTDRVIAAITGLALLALLLTIDRLRRPLWLALAGAFVLLDLAPLQRELAPRVSSSFYRDAPAAVAQFAQPRDAYRIFHVAEWFRGAQTGRRFRPLHPDVPWIERNAIPPLWPANYGLRTALELDYDLTALQCTNDFTGLAWDLQRLRPQDWLATVASMSNVRYVGIYEQPEIAFAKANGQLRNIQPVRFIEGQNNPRYYFATQVVAIRDRTDFLTKLASAKYPIGSAFIQAPRATSNQQPATSRVLNIHETSNTARIVVDTPTRAFLVLSITPHKYWRITIDGNEVPAVITNLAYQGVFVPAGRHVIAMRYHNPLIAVGGAITLAALLAALLAIRGRAILRAASHASSREEGHRGAPGIQR